MSAEWLRDRMARYIYRMAGTVCRSYNLLVNISEFSPRVGQPSNVTVRNAFFFTLNDFYSRHERPKIRRSSRDGYRPGQDTRRIKRRKKIGKPRSVLADPWRPAKKFVSRPRRNYFSLGRNVKYIAASAALRRLRCRRRHRRRQPRR